MLARLAWLLVLAVLSSGCGALLSAEPTDVPGAAATLTRSVRTPIPTPVRELSPAAPPNPVAARSPSPLPSPTTQAGRPFTQDELEQVRRDMERIVATPALTGVEALLLDRVSLATPAGGQVLNQTEAAQWLRDHAGSGIRVTRVEPNTQTVLIEVETEGWPINDPLEQGRVTFNLRRYAANGRQDEDNGDWKVDVISAE